MLQPPRVIWYMTPVGDLTEKTVTVLGELLGQDDKDDVHRAKLLSDNGVRCLDIGTIRWFRR